MVNEDGEYLVCMSVSDCPIPSADSDVEHCSECGADVWRAKSSPKEIDILCNRCLNELPAEKVQHSMPTESQLIDISEKLGLPVEIVKQRIESLLTHMNRGSKFASN